jgi:hypothetical protein
MARFQVIEGGKGTAVELTVEQRCDLAFVELRAAFENLQAARLRCKVAEQAAREAHAARVSCEAEQAAARAYRATHAAALPPSEPEAIVAPTASEAPSAAAPAKHLGRDETIAAIRSHLRARSGRSWSVTGGRGTAWGWISIHVPPKARGEFGYMSEADAALLAELLGLDRVSRQGHSIPAGSGHYRAAVERAEFGEVREGDESIDWD